MNIADSDEQAVGSCIGIGVNRTSGRSDVGEQIQSQFNHDAAQVNRMCGSRLAFGRYPYLTLLKTSRTWPLCVSALFIGSLNFRSVCVLVKKNNHIGDRVCIEVLYPYNRSLHSLHTSIDRSWGIKNSPAPAGNLLLRLVHRLHISSISSSKHFAKT